MRRSFRTNDAEYPALLREIPDPPTRLFVEGRPIEPAPCVAVVGTRRPTSYGLEVGAWFGRELAASGVVVVSGLARGIDAAAHSGSLESGGPTVAILGNGLDIVYPYSNRGLRRAIVEVGTVVTEHAAGVPALPHHFPRRNRIIAGMSLGIVIVEARLNGGAMITARLAMEFGREVFVVPGLVHSPTSAGPHALLRDGARPVTSPDEVLEDLNLLRSPEAPGVGLAPDEVQVLEAMGAEPQLLEITARMARLPQSAASSVLARLEVKGFVTRHPGGRFARSVAASNRSE